MNFYQSAVAVSACLYLICDFTIPHIPKVGNIEKIELTLERDCNDPRCRTGVATLTDKEGTSNELQCFAVRSSNGVYWIAIGSAEDVAERPNEIDKVRDRLRAGAKCQIEIDIQQWLEKVKQEKQMRASGTIPEPGSLTP